VPAGPRSRAEALALDEGPDRDEHIPILTQPEPISRLGPGNGVNFSESMPLPMTLTRFGSAPSSMATSRSAFETVMTRSAHVTAVASGAFSSLATRGVPCSKSKHHGQSESAPKEHSCPTIGITKVNIKQIQPIFFCEPARTPQLQSAIDMLSIRLKNPERLGSGADGLPLRTSARKPSPEAKMRPEPSNK